MDETLNCELKLKIFSFAFFMLTKTVFRLLFCEFSKGISIIVKIGKFSISSSFGRHLNQKCG